MRVVTALFLGLISSSLLGRVIHLEPLVDEIGEASGESWSSATYLRRALTLARPGDEIWMKAGFYTPLEGVELVPFRCASFSLPAGVSLFGGFSGNESNLGERRLSGERQTVLSGDFEGNDVTDLESGVTRSPDGIIGENARRILKISGGGRSTVVDGLTLTGAKRANDFCGVESVLVIQYGSPTIRNCRFVGNYGEFGGAIWLDNSPEPVIANCLFSDNEARESGGAIYSVASSPLVVNCTFSRNSVDGDGDTINCWGHSAPVVANCIL